MNFLKIISCVFFISLNCLRANVDVVQISAESLKQQMDNERVLVINVLNKNTFNDCSIEGSVNVGAHQLQQYARNMLKKERWHKNKKIVVYGATINCRLASYACKLLQALGFNNAWELSGGMQSWKQKGYPIRGNAQGQYLKES